MRINFLTIEEVLALHVEQIKLFGGAGGVRDLGLLESAVAQPSQTFAANYLHEDVPAMAAAYLYHIVLNHPFVDGNKRTGTDAAIVFLELNGYELVTDDDALTELVLSVAEGKTSKEEVARFIRSRVRPSPDP